MSSRDTAEARTCLRSLAVPFFHHELVKQALLTAMEDAAAAPPLLELLKSLAGSADVSPLQMQKVPLDDLLPPPSQMSHLLQLASALSRSRCCADAAYSLGISLGTRWGER